MIKINLLTEKKKKKKLKGMSDFVMVIIAVSSTVLILMGLITFLLKSNISRLRTESEFNKAKLSELNKKINEVKKYEKLNKEIEQRSVLIETLRKNQAIPVKMLSDVSTAVPEGVWLTSMTYNNSNVGLEGYAFTNIDIVSYVENLKKSENLADVYLEESKQVEVEKVQVYKFKLNFKMKV
ncbi:fimbrial type-4 assembly membrane protein [Dissulfurispira thermophila]|uniref:Fimbrial type-4 assembly membrane protein n=1 Tax=Dissulfurispira thermophila TaxID=2715679 RepID=A0A7G1GZ27_9BACT|nr:PilN domain-containing protein [Dissulfurispira thermophila]BCB95498.1 fimbrial type-4 assembly membrane protein [Dissulfurispira thermophila]